MTVYVNSQTRELADGATVHALLTEMNMIEKRVAVEVNRDLVIRQHWQSCVLKSGDRIEVVSFVGGG